MLAERACVRLFISVDLVGSTAYKHSNEERACLPVSDGPLWAGVFKEFYTGFPKIFERNLDGASLPEELRPKLVKTIGDEVLLQTRIKNSREARQVVHFLAAALVAYKKLNLEKEPLQLKGAAWIAGFPLNNLRIQFDEEAGRKGGEDFIGPSIDAGFRVAKAASPLKLVVTVDLALLLLAGNNPLDLYFDGTESFKGVLGGRPYPIIWSKVAGQGSELHTEELSLRSQRADKDGLRRYCEAYLRDCAGTWLYRPYLEQDAEFASKPAGHDELLRYIERVDEQQAQTGFEPQ